MSTSGGRSIIFLLSGSRTELADRVSMAVHTLFDNKSLRKELSSNREYGHS